MTNRAPIKACLPHTAEIFCQTASYAEIESTESLLESWMCVLVRRDATLVGGRLYATREHLHFSGIYSTHVSLKWERVVRVDKRHWLGVFPSAIEVTLSAPDATSLFFAGFFDRDAAFLAIAGLRRASQASEPRCDRQLTRRRAAGPRKHPLRAAAAAVRSEHRGGICTRVPGGPQIPVGAAVVLGHAARVRGTLARLRPRGTPRALDSHLLGTLRLQLRLRGGPVVQSSNEASEHGISHEPRRPAPLSVHGQGAGFRIPSQSLVFGGLRLEVNAATSFGRNERHSGSERPVRHLLSDAGVYSS
ncbi:hypothetical protein BC830DRAFT_659505 [Chytriomyces sp. MP71]|nr:hypothetical protein BC830DRAFT_659505 [Chytriomyces sp. MP71]